MLLAYYFVNFLPAIVVGGGVLHIIIYYSREFQNQSTIQPNGLRQANLQRSRGAFRKLHFDSTCRRRKPAKIGRTFPDIRFNFSVPWVYLA